MVAPADLQPPGEASEGTATEAHEGESSQTLAAFTGVQQGADDEPEQERGKRND
jgi:hypothetical protein